jgi:hypothetical protein
VKRSDDFSNFHTFALLGTQFPGFFGRYRFTNNGSGLAAKLLPKLVGCEGFTVRNIGQMSLQLAIRGYCR